MRNNYYYELGRKTPHTEPEIKNCMTCDRPFWTYVPDSHCHLPDGGIVCYRDPQYERPFSDGNAFGTFMNFDLFPELQQFDI